MFYYTNSFNKINNLFDELMGNPMRELEKVSIFDNPRSYSPTETEDSHMIELSVPGFTKKEIDVEVNDGTLTISSEIKEEDETKYKKSFSRSYYLPSNVDTDSCSAKLENGILSISFDKKVKSKKVSIK